MKVDTLNISDLVLTTISIITNKNIKKICIENDMYLLIENINFFYMTVDELKKFSKVAKKVTSDIGCKKNH
jgi:hypothetical protein